MARVAFVNVRPGHVMAIGLAFVISCSPLASFAGETAPQAAPISSAHVDHVVEAAHRFAIPARWIWAVMGQESGGDTGAISRAGAMGLMQIMPTTWTELRRRHALGANPYDPRDNIMAGAAYLRDMYDRYGSEGMLAAYNAGPARYEAYLRKGMPLPLETRRYLHRLLPLILSEGVATAPGSPQSAAPHWTQASLFPGAAGVKRTPAPAEDIASIKYGLDGRRGIFVTCMEGQP